MIIIETRNYKYDDEDFPQIIVDGIYNVTDENDALKFVKGRIERMIKFYTSKECEVTCQPFPNDTDFDLNFLSGTPIIYKVESPYIDESNVFIAFQLKP